ncbi:hypothetical protein EZV62_015356 [Acer yangbiense]|uniref:Uncharacterized protein n=1 Tax=Acer yangbiense TaxID=1000413 RepID=A0A5C7HKH7_9ROSI|nr:hypothetical protein EZV62_015356 [Acer yangbiense]
MTSLKLAYMLERVSSKPTIRASNASMDRPLYLLRLNFLRGFIFIPISAQKLKTNFEILSKDTPIPPFEPSRGTAHPPPSLGTSFYSNGWNFRMLPKDTPIPPSRPCTGTSDPSLPPRAHITRSGPELSPRIPLSLPPPRANSYSNEWNSGMLPKHTPIPPFGPSTGTSDQPPSPGANFNSNGWNFVMLPRVHLSSVWAQ